MTLYSITTEYQELIRQIAEGEIPEEAKSDTLEAVNGEWESRVDAVVSAIKNIKAEAVAIEAEIQALKERKDRKLNTVEKLSEYLKSSIFAVNKSSYESAKHSVSFIKSESVQISDRDAFIEYAKVYHPEALRKKETLEPNKDVIKKLLVGESIPYATIEKRQNIQIK